MENRVVVCSKCGWCHIEVSRDVATTNVNRFNEYFYFLTEKQRHDFYNNVPASVAMYETCFKCGGSYRNFQDAEPSLVPDGVTLQPIIGRDY